MCGGYNIITDAWQLDLYENRSPTSLIARQMVYKIIERGEIKKQTEPALLSNEMSSLFKKKYVLVFIFQSDKRQINEKKM